MASLKQLAVLLMCFVDVADTTTDWSLVQDKQGVRIYSQQNPNQDLKRFKGQTRIDYPADTILAALQDTQACPEWVHRCVSNRLVDMLDIRTRVYHTTINAPLWFKDRDFYQQAHVVYEPAKQQFTITFESRPDYTPESDHAVRIHDIEMKWTLKTLGNNQTLVTYEIYIDPKLPFKSINHAMIKKSVFKTMQGLKSIVNNPKYGETRYSDAELEMLTN